MVALSHPWVCFIVNHNFLRHGAKGLKEEMARVFGKDFVDFALAEEQADDVYAFVKFRDYSPHAEAMKASPAVKNVLYSSKNPSFLTDTEVRDFVGSMERPRVDGEFRVGDAVKVNNGHLANLVGIITRLAKANKYVVLFSFHTRRFRDCLRAQDLSLIGNVLVRSPVKRWSDIDRGLPRGLSHECVKRRTPHRKPARKRGKR